jgi:AbrB family looped-hinge helix DNA binding protein
MADLVRVKGKFQVTLPARVRSAAAIREGDYLEVFAVPEGILLRPQRIVASGSVRSILDFLRETHGPGRTKAQIDAELNAQRDQW